MIRLLIGSITKIRDCDVICNAANGIGVMGAGIAGAISQSAGSQYTSDVRQYCKDNNFFDPGQVYHINSSGYMNKLGVKNIFHIVTMKFPGGESSIQSVVEGVRKACLTAIDLGYESIAIPGLGTGIGGLDKRITAYRMASVVSGYQNKIKITIVDRNEEFIRYFYDALGYDILEKFHADSKSFKVK